MYYDDITIVRFFLGENPFCLFNLTLDQRKLEFLPRKGEEVFLSSEVIHFDEDADMEEGVEPPFDYYIVTKVRHVYLKNKIVVDIILEGRDL